MTYEQALAYIHGVYWRGSKLGLARITELLRRMGDPQKSLRFVHVAGTNGKGSACAMLDAILRAAGYKTGLYISPYLERFNERMQIGGVPIADDELCAVTELVRSHAEAMPDLPTEFEIVCAIAFAYFAQNGCNVVVLEVGLGGRLDATNVIDSPLAAVLMPIDYDHTEYLGTTLTEIAGEKCGILKRGTCAVSHPQQPEAMAVIASRCAALDVPLTVSQPESIAVVRDTLEGQVFDYRHFRNLELRLCGAHQRGNAATIIDTALALRQRGLALSDSAIRQGIADARWPGRFEVLRREPLVIVDGGHNPQGVRACADAAKVYLPGRKIVLLLGLLADKERAPILEALNAVADFYVATSPPNPRALAAEPLAKELACFGKPVVAETDIEKACARAFAIAKAENAVLLAVGSLYMTGSIRQYFLTRGAI